jgi:DNA-binding GntR family transcriptional regulator
MPVPDLADPRDPYLQIADDVRGKIKNGAYSVGSKLPSIEKMGQEYGSAAETIRNALRLLKTEGLVATHSTRGTFVLKEPSEPEPDPEFVRLASGMQDVLSSLDKIRSRLDEMERRLAALEERGDGKP